MRRLGGIGELQQATAEVQGICDMVKPQAELKTGRNFDVFTATSFKTQVVAGTNFLGPSHVTVHVGGHDYVHLRVYRTLPHAGLKLELHSLQAVKTEGDTIEYF